MDSRQYLESIGCNVKDRGRTSWLSCPTGTHSDSSPSCRIWEDDHVHCFGCGFHAHDVVHLVAQLEYPNLSQGEAYRAACEYVGSPLKGRPRERKVRRISAGISYTAKVTLEIATNIFASLHDAESLAYCASRGLSPKTLETYRIGYCPPGYRLDMTVERQMSVGLSWESGSCTMANRITLPSVDNNGDVTHIQGRTILPYESMRYNGTSTPKAPFFLWLPDVGKARIVWAMEAAIDAMRIRQLGHVAIAMAGSTLPDIAYDRLAGKIIVFARDSDTAGANAFSVVQRKMEKRVKALIGLEPLAPYKDLGEMPQHLLERLVNQIQIPGS